MERFSQLSNCLKSDNALGTSFWKSSKAILPTLVVVWLTTFIVTVLLGYWFSRLIWSLGDGSGVRTSENTARLVVLTNIQLFFLNKHSTEWPKHVIYIVSWKRWFRQFVVSVLILSWWRGFSEFLCLPFPLTSLYLFYFFFLIGKVSFLFFF